MSVKKVLLMLVALALVGVFAGAALAQDATTPKRPDAKAPAYFQSFLEKFASILGVDKDKVVAAAKEAGKQVVDEAVQQGRMTPEQADRIKSKIDQGRFFPCPFARHGAKMGGFRLDALAQALGMTADELKAELEQGKKISDIAREKGLTGEQLRQKVVEARIQAIRQAEEDRIPQDRAEEMIKKLENAPQGKCFFGRPFGPLRYGPAGAAR